MAFSINYDPSNTPHNPWLVLIRQASILRCSTLEVAIDEIMSQVEDEPHEFVLWNFYDGSWGITIVESDVVLTDTDQRLGTYPHSELRNILLTYGQMLPCKYRS